MRISLISPMPPARDGIADYSARLATAYEQAGHHVSVMDAQRLSWSPLTTRGLVREIRTWNPDFVHVQHGIATYGTSLLPLWALVAACRLRGLPVVVTHHEVTRDIERLGLVARVYYTVVSRLAALVHVHTRSAETVVRHELGLPADRVLCLPHPVYPLPTSDVAPDQLVERFGLQHQRVLLLFGFVHVEKGLRESVEGLGVLAARDPALAAQLTLVVAGDVRPRPSGFGRFELADRAYLDEVRSRVVELGLQDRVSFVGHVPEDEVAPWFALAEGAILPYTHAEQSGVANLAVAAGTPVLTSRNGGLGELFGPILPTFVDLSPDAVADGLKALLATGRSREHYAHDYAEITAAASPATLAKRIGTMLSSRKGLPVKESRHSDEVLA